MSSEILPLDGKWMFQQAGPETPSLEDPGWLPARVPGVAHLDLMASGQIPDPFYRLNELEAQWVEDRDWLYARRFDLPEGWLEFSAIELQCDGLDTFADIAVNGRPLASTDNMFHPWRFAIKGCLRPGSNEITVRFRSAVAESARRASQAPIPLMSAEYKDRIYIRKAQYAGGWDWGPRLMTCGIWRPIRLAAWDTAAIRSVYIRPVEISPDRAFLRIQADIEAFTALSGSVRVALSRQGQVYAVKIPVSAEQGAVSVSAETTIENPTLWWPNGYGEQAMYDIHAVLESEGRERSAWSGRTGLRKVELVRQPDEQGESFIIRINKRSIFCKGADWVPADSFLPRATPERYRELVAQARDAHMNMLRVWGGGIYEDPAFFAACDEMGIMVWQDFCFACAEYPEDEWFHALVEKEAREVIPLLRNHPSLALWCGNNENHWAFDEWWPGRDRHYGETIYDQILPAVCAELDPSRPYWPGSPYGGPRANCDECGDQHVWNVWSGWGTAGGYLHNQGRFISEFGFQSMPTWQAVLSYTDPEDRYLFSRAVDHHNKQVSGNARLCRFLPEYFKMPATLEDFVYLTQLVQAEAIKTGVEHWRRRMFNTAGTLYWQFNDCWPVASWSCLDYPRGRKALWHFSRRFYAPILVSFADSGSGLEVWVTSDRAEPAQGTLKVSAITFTGETLYERSEPLTIPADASIMAASLEPARLPLGDLSQCFLHATLYIGEYPASENSHFFAPFKYLKLPEVRLRPQIRTTRDGYDITLVSPVLVKYAYLEVTAWEGQFDDNFIDLLPGRPRTAHWQARSEKPIPTQFRKDLKLKCLR
ncbi:MAG: glycoside hydrolase family 2 protein [Armatimonadetes bacterium]|nr:glycoside hydrolase family 2 protein [Armatimonadota bacterium]